MLKFGTNRVLIITKLDTFDTFFHNFNGDFLLRRDFNIKKNSNVLIVEDVITTGKSSIECSKLISEFSANILGYACIIDRSNDESVLNEKIVSQVKLQIPTYTKDKLPKSLSSIKAIKPGSRNI